MSEDTKIYCIHARCKNCGAGECLDTNDYIKIDIPKGELISTFLSKIVCPVCGCTSLVKL